MKPSDYNILVVDDDPCVLKVTAVTLEREGYRITSALGGEAAMEALDMRRFDLVLTDLDMAVLNGGDVLKKARENQPQARVVIMTGSPGLVRSHCGSGNDPDVVLEKPFNILDLLSSLEVCLAPSAS